jgi:hypothetical protein
MSGIYQVYTIIINFLGFPDAVPQALTSSFKLRPTPPVGPARRRDRAKQHRGYIGRESSVFYAFRLIFRACQLRLGTRRRPGGPLGETLASCYCPARIPGNARLGNPPRAGSEHQVEAASTVTS